MNNDKKPHLWIPAQEVDDFSKKPTGRGNDYGLKHEEHGAKLSKGLQDVATFFKNRRSGDSFEEQDLFAFKVTLQEKEDIANQKAFIESEGLTINAVKDKRHAIVSANRSAFDTLQQRVNRYKAKGTKKAFQFIESFEPFTASDKAAESLIKYIERHKEITEVDVQIMLLPEMEPASRNRAERDISKKILREHGTIEGAPYHMMDGTSVIRSVLSPSSLKTVSEDARIYRIERTAFFRAILNSPTGILKHDFHIDRQVDVVTLPTVVVLDDGIRFPDSFGDDLVPVHWSASGCEYNPASFGHHGTKVAGKVVFGDISLAQEPLVLTPRARVIDARISDGNPTPSDVFSARIREAVEKFADIADIFNLSFNDNRSPIDGDEMSQLGSDLDQLSYRYNIRFVISAGNHNLWRTQGSLKDIIDDDDSRISVPADAMLGITVGAVVGADHEESISRINEIAPYSRKGPGFQGFYKPDLVAYGATVLQQDGHIPIDDYSICLSCEHKLVPDAGTSFTAPKVAGDLAQIQQTVPEQDIGLAQALLFNGTTSIFDKTGISQEDLDYASNLYGRGLSSPQNCIYSTENRVTFLNKGTMNRLTKRHVKFYIPTALADFRAKRGHKKLRITVTCIARPPIDRTKGSEYSAAYISASLHWLNSNGTNKTGNPKVSDNRNKWDTCYHFSNEFSSFSAGDWEVWLELFTRWGIKDEDEIPYSLVITLEDLTKSNNLYSEIVRETAGRFQQKQSARISI